MDSRRELPGPAAYRDAALLWRWIGIALVTLLVAALTILGLARALSPPAAGAARE